MAPSPVAWEKECRIRFPPGVHVAQAPFKVFVHEGHPARPVFGFAAAPVARVFSQNRQRSKPLFGKRPSGRRFQISFKIQSLLPTGKSHGGLDPPRTKLGRVRRGTVVVMPQPVLKVFCESRIEARWIGFTLQNVGVEEHDAILWDPCPNLSSAHRSMPPGLGFQNFENYRLRVTALCA